MLVILRHKVLPGIISVCCVISCVCPVREARNTKTKDERKFEQGGNKCMEEGQVLSGFGGRRNSDRRGRLARGGNKGELGE